jgi:hypothetical protein
MGRLRAVSAIFAAPTGLDAEQAAALNFFSANAADEQRGSAKSDRTAADDKGVRVL